MARALQPDFAGLFHSASSNVRERTPELAVDWDGRPRARRTYPGAPRTALGGRDFELPLTLGEALAQRRSVRDFASEPLAPETLGRLLHASAGVRGERPVEGHWVRDRAFPSAGGLYPLELYVATHDVVGVEDGIHHYDPVPHELVLRRRGRFGPALADVTIDQDMLRDAALVLALTAVPERSAWKYGQRGHRYVWIEAGHVAAHVYLVAGALGLGAVSIGGFFDAELDALLELPAGERTLYLVAVGRPAQQGGNGEGGIRTHEAV